MDAADDAGPTYTAPTAVRRAEEWLQNAVKGLVREIGSRSLEVRDVLQLGEFVEAVKPALCTRNGVGWKGAILSGKVQEMPSVERHLAACAECRYVGRPVAGSGEVGQAGGGC